MPFRGFEGPAGTGKTHQLMDALRARLITPLLSHQRILALTFMHGSRRRLDERLAESPETRGRAACITIDGFANNIVRRWDSSLERLPDTKNFEQVCDCCGSLLELDHIARWVRSTFPLLAVDEAQELSPSRLRIVKALSSHLETFIAADEFQCLDEDIDTRPFMDWFQTGDIQRLDQVRRTDRQGLLDGASALRRGQGLAAGPGLAIAYNFPNVMPFLIGAAILRAPRNTALLVAPGSAAWAEELIDRLKGGLKSSKFNIPPLALAWETGSSAETKQIAETVCSGNSIRTTELSQSLKALTSPPAWLSSVVAAIEYGRRACGREEWSRDAFHDLCDRKASAHRAYGYSSKCCIPVLSIHGAKNRQFENVVVLWGPGVPGSDEYQRRLIYNAITRAQRQCSVFVRTKPQLAAPPFTYRS